MRLFTKKSLPVQSSSSVVSTLPPQLPLKFVSFPNKAALSHSSSVVILILALLYGVSFATSCLARLLSLSGFGAVPVFGITLRGASCPKKVSKHLNSTFHLTLKKSSVSLFFCLHCIASKKTFILVKHYPFESKKLETPLVC